VGSKPSLLERLEECNVTLDGMVASALELFEPDEKADADKDIEEIRFRLRRIITSYSRDVNVESLILAALLLEDSVKRRELAICGDPVELITDEVLGMAIAEYIGGKKALFNYIRYDARKPGVLSQLGVFLDDAVGGLIAGCMTRLFEDWVE
jgi:alpha-ribazole phosphatase CobZ